MQAFSTVALGVCATGRFESGLVGHVAPCPVLYETNPTIPYCECGHIANAAIGAR